MGEDEELAVVQRKVKRLATLHSKGDRMRERAKMGCDDVMVP